MRGLVLILGLGALISVASCRDNRMSESFDEELPTEGHGGSGTAGSDASEVREDLRELGAHGSTGSNLETLDSLELNSR